ncbi:MAG TPA: cytochrome c [Cyclobacteriaceae bacterium]|nr:cytochrome c [Cyclobacteriaceae bacterium]
MVSKKLGSALIVGGIAAAMFGCAAKGDHTGREYAPNMYHSVAYEPLSQITDTSAGAWVNTLDNRDGEYFNSNRFNPHGINMRVPAEHTVKRNAQGWLPYRSENVAKDQIPALTANLKSPLDSSMYLDADGKFLYETYCDHCHGAKGTADGKVSDKFAGVANLAGDAYANISEGHIFHVITYGAGLMGPHGSQVSPEDRWKIARYIKTTLQKK